MAIGGITVPFNYYYCENAGPEYIQKYFPTSTPIASPTQEASPKQETYPTPQAEPSSTDDNSQYIIGRWSGVAQWLCDDNPPCMTTLDFKADGMVTVTCTYSGQSPAVMDTTWVLNDDNIQIQSETSPWIGTISGNTMQGNFVETRADYQCNGVWSVTREE